MGLVCWMRSRCPPKSKVAWRRLTLPSVTIGVGGPAGDGPGEAERDDMVAGLQGLAVAQLRGSQVLRAIDGEQRQIIAGAEGHDLGGERLGGVVGIEDLDGAGADHDVRVGEDMRVVLPDDAAAGEAALPGRRFDLHDGVEVLLEDSGRIEDGRRGRLGRARGRRRGRVGLVSVVVPAPAAGRQYCDDADRPHSDEQFAHW